MENNNENKNLPDKNAITESLETSGVIAGEKRPLMVACFSPKGGVGKTTISTQIAVASVMNGYSVAFYDLDPQRTASFYFSGIDAKYRPQMIYTDLSVRPKSMPQIIILDCPPNLNLIPPKDFVIVAPTGSTKLDLHAYRRVLEMEQDGYKVIKVINNFNPIKKDDKALLDVFAQCAIITSNAAIRHAMNIGKSIWNSNHPGGSKAKRQFNYLLSLLKTGKAESMSVEKLKDINAGNI